MTTIKIAILYKILLKYSLVPRPMSMSSRGVQKGILSSWMKSPQHSQILFLSIGFYDYCSISYVSMVQTLGKLLIYLNQVIVSHLVSRRMIVSMNKVRIIENSDKNLGEFQVVVRWFLVNSKIQFVNCPLCSSRYIVHLVLDYYNSKVLIEHSFNFKFVKNII